MLQNIRIILLHTSHSGNIGSVARAMKVMGLSQLYLADPQCDPWDDQARALASNASDVLQQAVRVDSFDEALKGCEWVLGSSARLRSFTQPYLPAREAAEKMMALAADHSVALVFGSEKYGMSNDELNRCHYHVGIPTHSEYSSLNLAQAVQVLCYELLMASFDKNNINKINEKRPIVKLASADQVSGAYQHLEQVTHLTGFYKHEHPHTMEARLRQLLNRAQMDQQDLNLFRGILSSIEKSLKAK